MKPQEITENRLQQQCFLHHWNNFSADRYNLILIHNTPRNAIEGSILKGMGMIKGAADLLYVGVFPCVWLECKLEAGRQSDHQKIFEANVRQKGHRYEIFRSLGQFMEILTKVNPEMFNVS